MKIHKRLAALVLALVLCLASAVTVSAAHPAVDLDGKGSITIQMTYDDQAVGGGSLVYYQVGTVKEDNGDFSFIPTSDFKDQFTEIETQEQMEAAVAADLAAALADFAKQNNVNGTRVEIPETGVVKLDSLNGEDGLPVGLYLVVQDKAASGFRPVSPFLVSVPQYVPEVKDEDGNVIEEDDYVYAVGVSSKMESLSKIPTPPPEDPGDPGDHSTTDTPDPVTPVTPAVPVATPILPLTPSMDPGLLPQTGQLNWPVPVLTVAGLGLFLAGWLLRFGRQGKHHDA